MLNTYDDLDLNSTQRNWLLKDLAAVNRNATPWIIVGMHAPWYTTYNRCAMGQGQTRFHSVCGARGWVRAASSRPRSLPLPDPLPATTRRSNACACCWNRCSLPLAWTSCSRVRERARCKKGATRRPPSATCCPPPAARQPRRPTPPPLHAHASPPHPHNPLGHVHSYERMTRVVNYSAGARCGPVHLTVGDGGNIER